MTAAIEFVAGDVVAGIRIPTREETFGKFVRRFGHTGAVIETLDGETRVIAKAERYVPGAEWLSGERPPVPMREPTPLYDELVESRARAVVPEWPESEAERTVEFARIQPAGLVRRLVRRLGLVRWSGTRVTAVVSSSVLFVGSGALWLVNR
ncbi:hypothetical protein ACIBCH_09650 [Amycolatopsis thailandensis]|uniref:hypothetical protein n=1 Tax=Amycolatopsis thailandensis TaxID=589330 RepID=UPI00379E5E26